MTPGVSTACFYPQLTEASLKWLADRRVRAVEVFFNSLQESSTKFVKEARRIADAGGVDILAVHPFTSGMEPILFFSRYERRFQEGLELYRRYYEAANLLGAKICVFHGNYRRANLPNTEYFELFGHLAEDAKSRGILLCHENVERCAGWEPAFFRALKRDIPDAGFVLDIKQCLRAGVDVFEMAEAMAGHVRHLHISDNTASADCLPPGAGDFNIAELLTVLRKGNFDGGVIVELYRENFGADVEILGSYQRICDLISTGVNPQQRP